MPEFDQCRQAAELKGVALKEVEEAARLAIRIYGQDLNESGKETSWS